MPYTPTDTNPFHPTLSRTITFNQLHQWLQKLKEATNPSVPIEPDKSQLSMYMDAFRLSCAAVTEVQLQLDQILRTRHEYATQDQNNQDNTAPT